MQRLRREAIARQLPLKIVALTYINIVLFLSKISRCTLFVSDLTYLDVVLPVEEFVASFGNFTTNKALAENL